MQKWKFPNLMVVALLAIGLTSGGAHASPQIPANTKHSSPEKKAATTEEAAKVIDLRTFPRLPGAKFRQPPGLARASYEAPGSVQDGFAFIEKQLVTAKWKELPGGYQSDRSSNGTFERDGYKLSVSVSQGRRGEADKVDVMMTNHGNVDTSQLPTPPGAKSLYSMPVISMFLTDAPVDETAADQRKLLLAAGWEPYGKAGDTQMFRQNAVQLSATISSSPAQQGKTMINFTTQLLSLEIPLPPDADRAQYSDSPPQLSFDVPGSLEDVAKFYRESLSRHGWKATSDELTKVGFRYVVIFRNAQKDMLQLRLNTVDGKARGLVQFTSAAQVAEMDAKIEAERKRKETEANKPKPQLTIKLPAGAKVTDQSAREIEFTVATGKAKSAVEAIQKQLTSDGWKAEDVMLEAMFGTVSMKKGQQSVSLTYVETGFLAPEITITSFGVELRTAL